MLLINLFTILAKEVKIVINNLKPHTVEREEK